MDLINEMESEAHVKHCLDFLRQSLMCLADRTVEVQTEEGGVTGFGTTHQCVDWDELIRTVEAWQKDVGITAENHQGQKD